MSIALVAAGTVASGTTSVTPAFGQATTAGNLLIALAEQASGISSLSVSGSGWVTPSFSQAAGVGIFYKANCGASESAPTITGSTGGTVFAVLAEFSGAATANPVDQGKYTSGGTTSPVVSAAPAADGAPGNLIVSVSLASMSMSVTVTSSDTYNNGATATNLGNNDSTSDVNHYRFSYGITTGNSSPDQNSHADNSMTLTGIGSFIVSFKQPLAVTLQDSAFTIQSGPFDTGNFLQFGDNATQQQVAQAITPDANVTLTGLWLGLNTSGSPTDGVVLEIQTDSGGSPSGTVVGTSDVLDHTALTGSGLDLVTFSTPVSLTAGTTYWIVFERSGAQSSSNLYILYHTSASADPPTWGLFKRFNGSTWSTVTFLPFISGFVESISASKTSGGVNITDTGLTVSDTGFPDPRVTRVFSDTGVSQSDSIVAGKLNTRSITDTGLSVSDSTAIFRVRAIAITDTGISAFQDSIGALVDRGLTITDSISARPTHLISVTGLTITDSIAGGGSGQHFFLTAADRGIGFVPVVFGPLG